MCTKTQLAFVLEMLKFSKSITSIASMHRKCIRVQDFIITHKTLTILWSIFHYFKKGISEFCNSQKNMSINGTKSDFALLILFLLTVKPDFATYQKGRNSPVKQPRKCFLSL